MPGWLQRLSARIRPRDRSRPPARRLRPGCPICEKPMERRGSRVWMCPDFPRCPGTVAADD